MFVIQILGHFDGDLETTDQYFLTKQEVLDYIQSYLPDAQITEPVQSFHINTDNDPDERWMNVTFIVKEVNHVSPPLYGYTAVCGPGIVHGCSEPSIYMFPWDGSWVFAG